MSRRCHHGAPRHAPLGRPAYRHATAAPDRHLGPASEGLDTIEPAAEDVQDLASAAEVEPFAAAESPSAPEVAEPPPIAAPAPAPMERHDRPGPIAGRGRPPRPMGPRMDPRPAMASDGARPAAEGEEPGIERTATAPQLRRFIKSRAYVPMHELRRRFAINGGDDEVTPVDLEPRKRVFVGLPEREGRLLGELLRAGDIGYELSLDPISPIVVGVYPMRPVTRV
jgi:hypothetical protein